MSVVLPLIYRLKKIHHENYVSNCSRGLPVLWDLRDTAVELLKLAGLRSFVDSNITSKFLV